MRAYSLVVKRAHGMRDIGVRFPVSPPFPDLSS